MVEVNNLIAGLPVLIDKEDVELISAWTWKYGDLIVTAQKEGAVFGYEKASGKVEVKIDKPVDFVILKGGFKGKLRQISNDGLPNGQFDRVRTLADKGTLYWKNRNQKETTITEARAVILEMLVKSPDYSSEVSLVETRSNCAGLARSEVPNYPAILIHQLDKPVVEGIDVEESGNGWNRVFDCVIALYMFTNDGPTYVESLARRKRLVPVPEGEILAAKVPTFS